MTSGEASSGRSTAEATNSESGARWGSEGGAEEEPGAADSSDLTGAASAPGEPELGVSEGRLAGCAPSVVAVAARASAVAASTLDGR